LCTIAEHVAPEEVEKSVKEAKIISKWFLVLLAFGFVFLAEQITVGRFGNTYEK